jgi:hypothetical protein
MERTCSTYGGDEMCVQVSVGKPQGRRSLLRPKRIWKNNIKIDPREVEGGAWIGSIWLKIGTGSRLL